MVPALHHLGRVIKWGSLCFAILFASTFILSWPPSNFGRHERADLWHTNLFVRPLKTNQHFFKNANSEKIQLFGARNETISFQLVHLEKGRPFDAVSIQEFFGPGELDRKNFKLFSLLDCQGGVGLDCLIPFRTGEPVSMKTEGAMDGGRVIWFDLSIPENQKPGKYHGSIKVLSQGDPIAAIEVDIEVYPFTLPGKSSLKADLNNYGVKFVRDYSFDEGSDEAYEVERAVYVMARNHGLTFNPLPYKSQRGNPHPTMAPELEGEGEQIRVKDWSEYDKRYGPLLDGTAFKDGEPIDHQYLPFNPEWPSDFSNYLNDRVIYEKEWIRIAKEFIEHFMEKGWDKTTFQIFLNQKPNSNNHIPWNLDEPKGDRDYAALRYFTDITHKAFSQSGEIDFKFRIDISHFYCEEHKGSTSKDFRVNKGNLILAPVDIWVISKHSMDSFVAQRHALELKKKGKTIFEYFSGERMPLIKDSLLEGIHSAWNAWLRKEDGILFWRTVKTKSEVSDGSDFLVYTGAGYRGLGPFASVRLKAIRRGVQDYEYFKLAPKAQKVNALIRDYMTGNPADYEMCRKKLAHLIISSLR